MVTADIGEGHNATARGLEQAARRLWPDCEVRWVDTLDAMGRGVGPTMRWAYVVNVRDTPGLYEMVYGSLWRRRWFAAASKGVIAAWSGQGLAPVIDSYDPDLIISTYPLGSAGLGWLRRNRGLSAPVAAWIADFAPHPFWVYPELDVHYVMHDNAVAVAKAAEPDARIAVAALPVTDAYTNRDRPAARQHLDLTPDNPIALLSCGSLAFGAVEDAVTTLLNTDPHLHIVAACGHNDHLHRRLTATTGHHQRLRILSWTDELPTYLAACDIVITNAGGMTALEALSCGRTVIMFAPIAAHGRANAALMADSGLAVLCPTTDDLARETRQLLNQPDLRTHHETTALTHAHTRTREDDLRALAELADIRPPKG